MKVYIFSTGAKRVKKKINNVTPEIPKMNLKMISQNSKNSRSKIIKKHVKIFVYKMYIFLLCVICLLYRPPACSEP